MADSSWDSYTEERRFRGGFGWVKWVVGIALGFVLIGVFFGTVAGSAQGRAWPTVRRLAQVLQTDEGAKAVYAASPDLKHTYPDLESFLSALARRRQDLASLPEALPRAKAFSGVDPGGQVMCRTPLPSGAYMHVVLRASGFFGLGGGIERVETLLFADSESELRSAFTRIRKLRYAEDWSRFLETAKSLETDEGARTLRSQNPHLAAAYPQETDFLNQVRRWRDLKVTLPASLEEAKPAVQTRRMHSPFKEVVTLILPAPQGPRLSMTWTNGQLSGMTFRFDTRAEEPDLPPLPPTPPVPSGSTGSATHSHHPEH